MIHEAEGSGRIADGDEDDEIDAILRELDAASTKYRARDAALKREIAEIRIRRRALMDHLARMRGSPPIRWPAETREDAVLPGE
jgi:hypothetical protein